MNQFQKSKHKALEMERNRISFLYRQIKYFDFKLKYIRSPKRKKHLLDRVVQNMVKIMQCKYAITNIILQAEPKFESGGSTGGMPITLNINPEFHERILKPGKRVAICGGGMSTGKSYAKMFSIPTHADNKKLFTEPEVAKGVMETIKEGLKHPVDIFKGLTREEPK